MEWWRNVLVLYTAARRRLARWTDEIYNVQCCVPLHCIHLTTHMSQHTPQTANREFDKQILEARLGQQSAANPNRHGKTSAA